MPWFVDDPFRGIIGPLSSDRLRQLAANDELAQSTLVAKQSSGPWVPASSVKGLFPEATSVLASPGSHARSDTSSRVVQRHEAPAPYVGAALPTRAEIAFLSRYGLSLALAVAAIACVLIVSGLWLQRTFDSVDDVSKGILGTWKSNSSIWKQQLDDAGLSDAGISFLVLEGKGVVFLGREHLGSFRFIGSRTLETSSGDNNKSIQTVIRCTKSRLQVEIEGKRIDFYRVASAEEAEVEIMSTTATMVASDAASVSSGTRQGDINKSLILKYKGPNAYREAAEDKNTELNMIAEISPQVAAESSKSFASAAAAVIDELRLQCEQVAYVGELFKTPAWKDQANVLARADAETARQIFLIESDTRLTQAEMASHVRAHTLPYAEGVVRDLFKSVKRD